MGQDCLVGRRFATPNSAFQDASRADEGSGDRSNHPSHPLASVTVSAVLQSQLVDHTAALREVECAASSHHVVHIGRSARCKRGEVVPRQAENQLSRVAGNLDITSLRHGQRSGELALESRHRRGSHHSDAAVSAPPSVLCRDFPPECARNALHDVPGTDPLMRRVVVAAFGLQICLEQEPLQRRPVDRSGVRVGDAKPPSPDVIATFRRQPGVDRRLDRFDCEMEQVSRDSTPGGGSTRDCDG